VEAAVVVAPAISPEVEEEVSVVMEAMESGPLRAVAVPV